MTIRIGEAVLNEQRHIGKMAAFVGYLPIDFFTNLAARVVAVSRWIPKVAHVLNPVALSVVGDVPAYSADQGHASSVTERDL